MKNKISDLRNHMFAALERLGSEDMSAEDLATEVSRSKAISDLGKVIVESAKTELLHAKIIGRKDAKDNQFMDEDITDCKQIDRPPAEYSNSGHLQVQKKYEQ